MQYMFCWSERRPADLGEDLGPVLIMLMAAAISLISLSVNITISFYKHSLMFCEQTDIFLFDLQNDENVSVL